MKINKSSWHYRFVKYAGSIPRNNLCDYVQQIVGYALLVMVAALLACLVVFAVGCGVAIFIIPSYMDIYGEDAPRWVGLVYGLGLVFWAVVCIYLAERLSEWAQIRSCRKELYKAHPDLKKPSLIAEYIKAKKQKVCPMIEFEEKQ